MTIERPYLQAAGCRIRLDGDKDILKEAEPESENNQ